MDSTNNINLGKKLSIDKKGYFIQSKFCSDNTLPNILSNKYNKSLITGINISSEISTKYSSSGFKEKLKIKNRIEIKESQELNQENVDKIFNKKIILFEALENLLLDDNDNLKGDENEDNEEKIEHKKKRDLTVPKLDFSYIFNHYKKRPLVIHEIKYIQDSPVSSEGYKDIKYYYNNNNNKIIK